MEAQKIGLRQRYKYGGVDMEVAGKGSGGGGRALDSSLPPPMVGAGGKTTSCVLRGGKGKQPVHNSSEKPFFSLLLC